MKYLYRVIVFKLTLCLAGALSAGEPHDLRISVDTGPNHLRNITINRFIELLAERTKDIRPWLYPSGQLSKDKDIPKALHWGYVDMGVVARLKLTPFVPDMNIASIPSIYGLSAEKFHQLFDGEIGQALARKLERLDIKVLGKPIDLGFANVYTNERQIQSSGGYSGLKLRVSGGSGQWALLQAFGANAILLPFPDVPLALAQGSLDGLQTTHETAVSGKLWEFGLKYCYEDQASFIDYIPIISSSFWNALPHELQALMTQTWNDVALDGRLYSRQRQAKARAVLIERGIVCTQASEESLKEQRQLLAPVGRTLVQKLGMDEALYLSMMQLVSELSEAD